MSNISRCDNGACYNENLIEEQALKIQELKTELSNLHDDYRGEQEVKSAWKSKFLKEEKFKNELIASISFAVYFMKESGYHCLDNIEPEYKMYKEFRDILNSIKKGKQND